MRERGGGRQDMVSRRKILSRSRDELNFDCGDLEDIDEDAWHDSDRLFRDHINEILLKWEQIDDGIWSKIILFERNRRVAKAYARTQSLSIDGTTVGFDGFRIGLNGFENPMRDRETKEARKLVGQGVRLKIDDSGNIAMMKVDPITVCCYEMGPKSQSTLDDSLLRNNGELGEKPVRLFVMKKFHSLFKKEQRQKNPDINLLQKSCISIFSLVKKSSSLLKTPLWVMIVNMVALEMIRPFMQGNLRLSTPNLSLYERAPVEEDPYSLPGNGSPSSRGYSKCPLPPRQPPKLPPRDTPKLSVPTPDYDVDDAENDQRLIKFPTVQPPRKKEEAKIYDDPYYYGFRARVPKFASRFNGNGIPKKNGFVSMTNLNERLCYDSGIGDSEVYTNEDDYSGIYGRFRSHAIYAPLGPQRRNWN